VGIINQCQLQSPCSQIQTRPCADAFAAWVLVVNTVVFMRLSIGKLAMYFSRPSALVAQARVKGLRRPRLAAAPLRLLRW